MRSFFVTWYVKDRRSYYKVRGREVQWERKLWFMVKENEGIAGAIGSLQDLAGKFSKICRHIRWELEGDESKSGKHDPIMPQTRLFTTWRMKKWQWVLLAQKLITLVLMIINSYNYSTNNLVFIKFQIFNQDLSRYLASSS